jgi:hypothetical protein
MPAVVSSTKQHNHDISRNKMTGMQMLDLLQNNFLLNFTRVVCLEMQHGLDAWQSSWHMQAKHSQVSSSAVQ